MKNTITLIDLIPLNPLKKTASQKPSDLQPPHIQ